MCACTCGFAYFCTCAHLYVRVPLQPRVSTWFSTGCGHRRAHAEQMRTPPHLQLLTWGLSCPSLSLWVLSLFAGAHWLAKT